MLDQKVYCEMYGLEAEDLELMQRICLPTKLVCQHFGINSGALNMRVKRLLDRFGVENRRALIVRIIQLGLVTPQEFDYRVF